MACAPSEDSHQSSLIKIFAVRMKKLWVLSYPLSTQRRLWSVWADWSESSLGAYDIFFFVCMLIYTEHKKKRTVFTMLLPFLRLRRNFTMIVFCIRFDNMRHNAPVIWNPGPYGAADSVDIAGLKCWDLTSDESRQCRRCAGVLHSR